MLPRRPDLAPLPGPPDEPLDSGWRTVFGLAVCVLGGAVVSVKLSDYVGIGPDAFGAVVLVGASVALAVHEAGHVAGGRLVGFRLLLLVVGPVQVAREKDGLRWGLNRSFGLAGGLALSVPTDDRDLHRRTAVTVAGGPAASLALGALGLGLWAALGGAASAVALLVGLASFGIAAVTLWPGRPGGLPTDGARLLRLARGGPAAEREVAVLALVAQSVSGVRPRAWDADLLDAALSPADGDLMEESARALATARALDAGDAEAARDQLERRVALWWGVPPVLRTELATDAAVFEGAVRGDAARARAWLDRIDRRAALAAPSVVALAEAVAAHVEGDGERARRHAAEARDGLDGAVSGGSAAARRDWLAGLGL